VHLPLRPLSVSLNIQLRAVTPGDEGFLAELYATTRADELAGTGWTAEQKDAFCTSQFRLQQAGYAREFSPEGHRLILRDGSPVGRIWTHERTDHVLLVDIAILPEHRSAGIGGAVLGDVVADVERRGLGMRTTSRRTNTRAHEFYRRLGFRKVGGDDMFVAFERPAG
jgi:ribosomal protein S18 acetylase RimI-like enzyme